MTKRGSHCRRGTTQMGDQCHHQEIHDSKMIDIFIKATIAISRVNSIEEVVEDPLVKVNRSRARTEVRRGHYDCPSSLQEPLSEGIQPDAQLPPRFGEHNEEIYSGLLGYSAAQLKEFKEKNII